MFSLIADFYPFTARADEVAQGSVEINGVAQLVKVGHLQIGALAHRPAVWLQLAQYQFKQGGLAGAVGAYQPDFVAPQYGRRQVANNLMVAK